jgi:hypothetical protein
LLIAQRSIAGMRLSRSAAGNEGHGQNGLTVIQKQAQQNLLMRGPGTALGQRQDGLTVEAEAVFLHRLADAHRPLHLPTPPLHFAILLLIDMHAVAPQILGRITGGIGRAQQTGQVAAVGIDFHHADADPNAEGALLPEEAEILHRLPQQFGNGLGRGSVTVFQKHPEFIATQARQGVPFPQAGLQQGRKLAQQFVTGHMAAGVVDHLELVEIEVAQGMHLTVASGAGEGALDPCFEFPAVDEAGKRVVGGLVTQA